MKTKAGTAPPARRALIIGAGTVGQTLAKQLTQDGRYVVVGFIDDDEAHLQNNGWPILGPRHSASDLIRVHSIDDVFVAYAPTWQQKLAEDLAQSGMPVQVKVVPSFYEAMLRMDHIESIGDVALVPLTARGDKLFDRMKRFCDLVLSVVALALLFPILVLITVLVRLSSPGPALFAQERIGRYGRPFTLYKFRTMANNAESGTGPVLSAGKADQRLTPLGRWLRLVRLDELPQLVNVIRGEMSLVGPRPERPVFVEKFVEQNPIYARRHEVRPGITGLAQVYGGYHTDARDKLRFDLFYISHRSLFLDISILLRTVVRMFIKPNGC